MQLTEIKKEHPKAVHHCFAYRLDEQGDSFRVNDDGEPSGSAGRPILGQIDSKGLTYTAIIVVRYFGGTLLGVPGLIKAYKTVAALVLQTIPVIQKPILKYVSIHFEYNSQNEVMKIVKSGQCIVIEKNINLFSNMKIGIPKSRLEEVLHLFKELRNVEIEKIL